MIDFTLSTLAWIIGPVVLAAAFVYAIMRRRRSRVVTLPPDHPAPDRTTEASTNRQEPSR
ncbi:MAG: hypothetical protein ACK4MV_17570 [Beijerinckiaceae bacterium]